MYQDRYMSALWAALGGERGRRMTTGGETFRVVLVPEKSHPYDPWSEAVAACAEGGGKIGYFGRLAAGKYRPLILSVRERAWVCEARP